MTFIMDKMNYLLMLNGQPRCLVLDDYNFRAEFEGDTAVNDTKAEEQTDSDSDANNTEDQINDDEQR